MPRTTPICCQKNPLQLGATFWHFRHESRVTSPPIWVQNLVFPPLWAAAKVFGLRPYHQHWDSRTDTTHPTQPAVSNPTDTSNQKEFHS